MLSRFRGILQESQMRHVVEASWSEKEILTAMEQERRLRQAISTAKQLNACITMRADAMRVRSAWRAATHANAARPNVQVLNAVNSE